MTAAPSVAVVGAGVSGLTAAYQLRRRLGARARIIVFEQSARVGGVLRTVTLADQPFDVGAEAFLSRRPEVPELLAELGLEDQLVRPGGAQASVRAAGRTVALPARTVMGIPSTADSMTGLLSADALEQIGRVRASAPRWDPDSDISVGELVRASFGDETVMRSVDPLLGGVYSGRADSLGVRATVPALAAALDAGAPTLLAAAAVAVPVPQPGVPVFGALRGGYTRLISALQDAAAATLRLSTAITGIDSRPGGWQVRTADGSRENVDAVVLAVPAPAARKLLASVAPRASRAAGDIPLASSAVVGLAYAAADVDAQLPRTSGLLVATGEPLHAKAFTHSSRKWPHLSNDAVVLLRASLGRFGDAVTLQVDDVELVAMVLEDLTTLHGIAVRPLDIVVQRWGGGLPQYGPGHLDRIATIASAVDECPGLAVAGSMLRGVGVPACIASGRAAADDLVEYLTADARRDPPVAP